MKMLEVRSIQKLRVFRNSEMNFQFVRALSCMPEKGAEIGECLSGAASIRNADPASWVNSFRQMGERIDSLGQTASDNGSAVDARECFLRASNYFRAAEYFSSPRDSQFLDLWKRSRASFQSACPLLDCRAEPVRIPFEGGVMPGYFLQPSAPSEKRPTLMIHGGADTSGEELFFWCGAAAVRRGYNALIFEGPGSRGAVHLYPELVERPDFEVPAKVAVDYALSRPEVDPDRLALVGFSAGGYRCARAAAFDRRIRAVVLSAPIRDIHRLVAAAFSNLISGIPAGLIDSAARWRMRRDPMLRVFLEYALWKNGFQKVSDLLESTKEYTLDGLEQNITCPVLALIGAGEGMQSLLQARQFFKNVTSAEKTLRVFTASEGADDHCQINNHTLRNQVVFDWLDRIFRIRPRRGSRSLSGLEFYDPS